jgi:hypothetical protein
MADIKRLFTPEFRNRLDAIVSFKALDDEVILRVVDKFLLQLEAQLHEKKVEVTFTDKLRKHLAKKGFDPLMGARPMQRLIQDTIRRRWPTSCCSGVAILAHKNGWEGVVVYGCIRDSGDINGIDIGVRALDTHPQKSIKKNVGDRDLAVTFGGITFNPGEHLYADEDGVLVSSKVLI